MSTLPHKYPRVEHDPPTLASAPMIAPGLRARDLFTNGRIDYVCTDCVTVVPDPEKGCLACTTRRENKAAKKREFFEAMERKREEDRLETERLRAEALSGLEVKP